MTRLFAGLLLLAAPLAAQIDPGTARGGYYYVMIGDSLVSAHADEGEARARAIDEYAVHPGADVYYMHGVAGRPGRVVIGADTNPMETSSPAGPSASAPAGFDPDESLDWHCNWPAALDHEFPVAPTPDDISQVIFGKGGEPHHGPCFDEYNSGTGGRVMNWPVSAEGLGFPEGIDYAFRVAWNSTIPGGGMISTATRSFPWREMQVGESTFYRVYEVSHREPGSRINAHMLHVGNNNSRNPPNYYSMRWNTQASVAADGTYHLSFQTWLAREGTHGRGAGGFRPTTPAAMQRIGQINIREWRVTRTDADSVLIDIRISDVNGNIRQTSRDFLCGDGGACEAFGGRNRDYVGQYKVGVPDGDFSVFRGLEIGNNGSEGGDPSTTQFWDWAALAVRVTADRDAWIGPFPVGPERR